MGVQPSQQQVDEIIVKVGELGISVANLGEIVYTMKKLQDGPTKAQKEAAERAEAARKAKEQRRNRKQMEDLYNKGKRHYNNKEYQDAFKCFKESAESGNAAAQIMLGNCYYYGNGVSLDYTEAVKWYRKAAEQGHSWGQGNLGICYYNGKGVSQDYTEAVKWYLKAAEQGNSHAQNNLANCYYNGEGVKADKKLAKEWLEKSVQQGNQDAQETLKRWESEEARAERERQEAERRRQEAAEREAKEKKQTLWTLILVFGLPLAIIIIFSIFFSFKTALIWCVPLSLCVIFIVKHCVEADSDTEFWSYPLIGILGLCVGFIFNLLVSFLFEFSLSGMLHFGVILVSSIVCIILLVVVQSLSDEKLEWWYVPSMFLVGLVPAIFLPDSFYYPRNCATFSYKNNRIEIMEWAIDEMDLAENDSIAFDFKSYDVKSCWLVKTRENNGSEIEGSWCVIKKHGSTYYIDLDPQESKAISTLCKKETLSFKIDDIICDQVKLKVIADD